MNFLAHSYLSFNHPEILVGNMISDFVKGRKKFDYPDKIQNGITLHRQIDSFTDDHAATKEAKKFLQPAVGLYAGAFIDVVYDHFLANDSGEFTDTSLQAHVMHSYDVLESHADLLPAAFKSMLPYMRAQNWLYNYKSLQGIEKSFGGVVRRARYLDSSSEVFQLFIQHYAALQNCYSAFFPSLKTFSINKVEELIK